ncbi:MAG: fibronectin type III domain-containing protein [Candidatus Hydrogenedentota bacterium]
MNWTKHLILPVILLAVMAHAAMAVAEGIEETMDDVVTRLYAEHDPDFLRGLDTETILSLLTSEERAALATQYQQFTVDVPATVYLMRHVKQKVVPYWLPEAGFEKTSHKVRNEHYTYEVWKKEVPAGRVELGINGFGKHRPVYFAAVSPQDAQDTLHISDHYPAKYDVRTLEPGALTYHDWTELVLTDVPEDLRGAQLFTTVRGRSREAHLIGGFRTTPHPSSPEPDQVTLTWADDPATTQAIQWRTDTSVSGGSVRYRPEKAAEDAAWQTAAAQTVAIQDRMLMNDRYVHHHTALLEGLEPDTAYTYRVGDDDGGWSAETGFTTGPADDAPFTFIYFGDTHRSPAWGAALEEVFAEHPDAKFYTLAGDLVGTGMDRNDWDEFFHEAAGVFDRRPVVPCIGNHDDQDGLGAGMYLEHFALPENGPEEVRPEGAYTLRYSNALFIILDIGSSEEAQAQWLEEVLANTGAKWKFAMFHFPPYAPDEDYPVLRQRFGGLFEEYGLDLVMTGHVHYYLRTKPINGGVPAETGTTYITSIAVPYESDIETPDYAAAVDTEGPPVHQLVHVSRERLVYTARDADGETLDAFVIEK